MARRASNRLEEVQSQAVEEALGLDVELEQLAGEDQDSHADQDQSGADLDRRVMALEEAERARRSVERRGREEERQGEARRVDSEQSGAVARALSCRVEPEDRP